MNRFRCLDFALNELTLFTLLFSIGNFFYSTWKSSIQFFYQNHLAFLKCTKVIPKCLNVYRILVLLSNMNRQVSVEQKSGIFSVFIATLWYIFSPRRHKVHRGFFIMSIRSTDRFAVLFCSPEIGSYNHFSL